MATSTSGAATLLLRSKDQYDLEKYCLKFLREGVWSWEEKMKGNTRGVR